MTEQEAAQRIQRIQAIYAEFKREIDGLKKEQHVVINQILERIKHEDIDRILKQLKQS